LLPCLGELDLRRVEVLWSLRREDVGLAVDVLAANLGLRDTVRLFLTGVGGSGSEVEEHLKTLSEMDINLHDRRMARDDTKHLDEVERWYICTGTPQRLSVLEWLQGKEVIYEDFNF